MDHDKACSLNENRVSSVRYLLEAETTLTDWNKQEIVEPEHLSLYQSFQITARRKIRLGKNKRG